MPCYHPLKGFVIGTNPETGKRKLKVCSYDVQALFIDDVVRKFERIYDPVDGIPETGVDAFGHSFHIYKEFVHIPCGKCIGCKFDYARNWANRMMLESLDHDSNIFVTLTYDDVHIQTHCLREYAYELPTDPENYTLDADNINSVSKIKGNSYSLNKRDFQLFMKRLRKRFPDQTIRFYACGEYGSQTMRPHYHAIIFGLELPDKKFFKFDKTGHPLYSSEILSEVWPFGFALFGEVTWNTCAYTARYVTKKMHSEYVELYERFNIDPEFCLMSRRPGIARNYFEQHKEEIYENGDITLVDKANGHKAVTFRPPGYFNDLYDVENPERVAEIKDNLRRIAENRIALELARTSKSYLDYLATKEYNFTHKVTTKVPSISRGGAYET